MTIVNAVVHPTFALIGVDTELADAKSGERRPGSKMVPLPHANAVMACRGSQALVQIAAMAAHGDFDRIVEGMPVLAPWAHGQVITAARQQGLGEAPGLALERPTFVIVGPSRKFARLACYEIVCDAQAKSATVQENDFFAAPWLPEWGAGVKPGNSDELFALACRQMKAYDAAGLADAGGCGGSFVVARLTMTDMTIRNAGELPRL